MTEKEYRNLDEQAPEWYITSQASFWDNSRREKSGIPLGFSGEFDWAGSHWIVPIRHCHSARMAGGARSHGILHEEVGPYPGER